MSCFLYVQKAARVLILKSQGVNAKKCKKIYFDVL